MARILQGLPPPGPPSGLHTRPHCACELTGAVGRQGKSALALGLTEESEAAFKAATEHNEFHSEAPSLPVVLLLTAGGVRRGSGMGEPSPTAPSGC